MKKDKSLLTYNALKIENANMNINKQEILVRICYTELVYERINKKLNINFSKKQIEEYIYEILSETDKVFYLKKGKNFYIRNIEKRISITINSNTYRVITVDLIPSGMSN